MPSADMIGDTLSHGVIASAVTQLVEIPYIETDPAGPDDTGVAETDYALTILPNSDDTESP
jgi:hypothetical protein